MLSKYLHSISQINRNRILGGALISLLFLALTAVLLKTDILSEVETRSWDWRLAHIADPKAADPLIKIIMLDQTSLERMANEESISWPWPRELYVPILEFLKMGGAKGVAFDILYSERSHFSVNDDHALAESLKGGMPTVLAAAIRSNGTPGDESLLSLFRKKQEQLSATQPPATLEKLRLSRASDIVLPIEELLQSAKSVGNVAIPNDSDGIFRHAPPGAQVIDTPILSLPFALLQAIDPFRPLQLDRLNSRGEFAVRFAGPARTYKTYSYYAILRSYQAATNGQPPLVYPTEFKDSYVFVGMDAPGLLDLRPTPLSRSFPGVEYHATVLDNALHNSFLTETTMPTNLVFAAIAILTGVFGILFLSRPLSLACVALGIPASVCAAAFLAASWGYWIPLMVPLLCAALSIGSAFAYQYQLEGRAGRFLRNAFQFYLSPQLIERIIEDPSALTLGGERKELTILFCDIEGFTAVSETLDPQDLGALLNEFLSAMTKTILEHQGTVDKYIGDAIVAFWNAPVSLPNHPSLAVQSALECQKKMSELQRVFQHKLGIEIRLRIGLNTGLVSVGNFGSRERFNYTAIGDTVNVASRLEGANKFFGTRILISQHTFERLAGDIICRYVGRVRVVGRNESLPVYEPVTDGDSESLTAWNDVHHLLGARELERARLKLLDMPTCKLHVVYLARISELLESGEPWDDTWNLTEK